MKLLLVNLLGIGCEDDGPTSGKISGCTQRHGRLSAGTSTLISQGTLPSSVWISWVNESDPSNAKGQAFLRPVGRQSFVHTQEVNDWKGQTCSLEPDKGPVKDTLVASKNPQAELLHFSGR